MEGTRRIRTNLARVYIYRYTDMYLYIYIYIHICMKIYVYVDAQSREIPILERMLKPLQNEVSRQIFFRYRVGGPPTQ